MSIESWDPTAAESFTIQAEVLSQFAAIGATEPMANLSNTLSSEEIQQQAPIMRLSFVDWQQHADHLDSETLWQLIKFFTLAEEQLSGWEGQEKSPVIYLNKLLKLRKEPLSKEQLVWIKTNSKNRFLPNGAL